jgi:YhcH/YjgK/YiaL family protein
MMYDHLRNRATYAALLAGSGRLGADIAAGLEALAALDPASLSPDDFRLGKRVVVAADAEGDRIWYSLQEYPTKPPSACVMEAHFRHIDIHCVLEGLDGVGILQVASLTPKEKDEAKDYVLFASPSLQTPPLEPTVVMMKPRDFLVCFTDDAHMPMMGVHGTTDVVRKAILKIRL